MTKKAEDVHVVQRLLTARIKKNEKSMQTVHEAQKFCGGVHRHAHATHTNGVCVRCSPLRIPTETSPRLTAINIA
jgi:hypothetical protein